MKNQGNMLSQKWKFFSNWTQMKEILWSNFQNIQNYCYKEIRWATGKRKKAVQQTEK